MTEQPLVILASARKPGDTTTFLDKVFAENEYKLINLSDFSISPYSYANKHPETDDFFQVFEVMLQHRVIVFATPVYWYAMSGLLKMFFDRFTDVVTTKKELGRQLYGKSTFLVAVGADEKLPDGFEIPFKLTSRYLGMNYRQSIYYSTKFPPTKEGLQQMIKAFSAKVNGENCND